MLCVSHYPLSDIYLYHCQRQPCHTYVYLQINNLIIHYVLDVKVKDVVSRMAGRYGLQPRSYKRFPKRGKFF